MTFGVPVGYRLVTTGTPATVDCACGCGWTVPLGTLSGMPEDVREHLFQYHQDWHTKKIGTTERQSRTLSADLDHAMTPIHCQLTDREHLCFSDRVSHRTSNAIRSSFHAHLPG